MSSFLAYSALALSMVILLVFDRWVLRLSYPLQPGPNRERRFYIRLLLVGVVLYVLGAIWLIVSNEGLAALLGIRDQPVLTSGLFRALVIGHMVISYVYALYLERTSRRQAQAKEGI